MEDEKYYNEKLPEITAIKDNDLKSIKIPVAIYLQEANNLYKRCQIDKKLLQHYGLDWEIVEDIPKRIGALREAETQWNIIKLMKKENTKKWKIKAKKLYKMRNFLLHKFRFAYRQEKKIKEIINKIAKRQAYAAMIQDLNDLAVLGKNNLKELKAIDFNIKILDNAVKFAKEMAAFYAKITAKKNYYIKKKIRNQAYTYLKKIFDEVYIYGKFVYWKNPDRKKNYRSTYIHNQNKKQISKKKRQKMIIKKKNR